MAGDDQSGFVVNKLHGLPLERDFLASWGEGMLCCIRMEPLSPLLRAEEVLPTLRFLHWRQVCGVAFITAAHTATAAEPSQVVSASPRSEVDNLIDNLKVIGSGDVRVEDTSNNVLKESGFSLEPSHPAACVQEDASHSTQQTDSDVPPVKATPKKLVIKGATKQSRTWVVDEDTGRPTCFRNNYKEWTEPETVPVPWFRRGASTFFDNFTGETRTLTYDDMRNDLNDLKSRAGAEKPLRFSTFGAVNLAYRDKADGIAKRLVSLLHKDKEQVQVANGRLSTGMLLCRGYPGGCGFCVTY